MPTLIFLLPQWILLLAAGLVFLFDLTLKGDKTWLPTFAWLSSLGSLTSAVGLLVLYDIPEASVLWRMITIDSYSMFFQVFAPAVAILVILVSQEYMKPRSPYRGEYYAFILLACYSVALLGSSTDLLTLYVTFELLSITSYILTGFLRYDPISSEAAMKYFLFGAMSSAFMLYGISLVYGVTTSTNLQDIAGKIGGLENNLDWAIYLALVLLMAGFGYKIVSVPFHQWSPDAYTGAPTPVTAFLAVGSIGGGFAVLVRVLLTAFPVQGFHLNWTAMLMALSMMSMTLGNMVAISQKNIKRMLAYSGIAHTGYVLIGLVSWEMGQAGSVFDGISGILMYLLVYLAANLGAFSVVIAFEQQTESAQIEDYAGLINRSPMLAISMVIFLLSLTGIPGTGGFIGKLMVFGAAMRKESYVLVLVAVINCVIAGFYYFKVIRFMLFQPSAEPSGRKLSVPRSTAAVVLISCGLTLLMGLAAQPFIAFVKSSLQMLS